MCTSDLIALRQSILSQAKRVIIKIGSRTLANDPNVFSRIAQAVATIKANSPTDSTSNKITDSPHGSKSCDVLIVSSGAIALGLQVMGIVSRPKEMAKLQAAAAVGQSVLMRRYEEAFEQKGIRVAQILLTHADLADRVRANNARAAIEELLSAGITPIINENDTVAVEEIRFGDNDQLASMVTPLVGAQLLILLSDVAGLLDRDGHRVPFVRDVATEALPLVNQAPKDPSKKESVGTGGMASKLEAARRGTLAGASVFIADARSETVLTDVLEGRDVGTLFAAREDALAARKHWIIFTLRPRGTILVDAGAKDAILERGGSLLPVGVLGVRGSFGVGDAVQITDAHGHELARGLASLGAFDVARIAGKKGADVEGLLGRPFEAVIHRDDLVLVK